MIQASNPAVVLGLFETGLAVCRSLGRAGVHTLGFDHSRKIGFYSRYVKASICPHPLDSEGEFVQFLLKAASVHQSKPVLFITADEFVMPVSRNRKSLEKHYLMNLPPEDIIECIADKFKQSELALGAGIPVPQTFIARNMNEVEKIKNEVRFPAFIKGADVTVWRKHFGGHVKGFILNDQEELIRTSEMILRQGVSGLIQEIIPGSDTQIFVASFYVSREGEILASFGHQKLRQQPVGFGFGCVVESIEYPELLALGRRFFEKIGYRGVGTSEFKMDMRDGQLKHIELNPRYWQQNALGERCGMNFPLMNYLDLTGSQPQPILGYKPGIKWINIYADFDSFRDCRRREHLSFLSWIRSRKGDKIYSDLASDDIIPGLHGMLSLFARAPKYIAKRIASVFSGSNASKKSHL